MAAHQAHPLGDPAPDGGPWDSDNGLFWQAFLEREPRAGEDRAEVFVGPGYFASVHLSHAGESPPGALPIEEGSALQTLRFVLSTKVGVVARDDHVVVVERGRGFPAGPAAAPAGQAAPPGQPAPPAPPGAPAGLLPAGRAAPAAQGMARVVAMFAGALQPVAAAAAASSAPRYHAALARIICEPRPANPARQRVSIDEMRAWAENRPDGGALPEIDVIYPHEPGEENPLRVAVGGVVAMLGGRRGCPFELGVQAGVVPLLGSTPKIFEVREVVYASPPPLAGAHPFLIAASAAQVEDALLAIASRAADLPAVPASVSEGEKVDMAEVARAASLLAETLAELVTIIYRATTCGDAPAAIAAAAGAQLAWLNACRGRVWCGAPGHVRAAALIPGLAGECYSRRQSVTDWEDKAGTALLRATTRSFRPMSVAEARATVEPAARAPKRAAGGEADPAAKRPSGEESH